MASLYDELSSQFEQEDGSDASDTSDTEAIVSGNDLYSDVSNDEALKIKEARTRAFRRNEEQVAPFDVMGSVTRRKEAQAEPELSLGRLAGTAVDAGKATFRQVGVFGTYGIQIDAMRRMSDQAQQMERDEPWSMFENSQHNKAMFMQSLKDRGISIEELKKDPKKFENERVQYMLKQNKDWASNMEMVRGVFQDVYKADPAYFQSSGWIEDVVRGGADFAMQIALGAGLGPAAPAAWMFAKIGGARAEQEIANGKTPEEAMKLGLLDATFQAPLEQIGVGRTIGWIKPRKAIFKKMKEFIKTSGQEGLTEYAQKYPELVVDLLGDTTDMNQLQKIEKFLDIVLKDEFQKGALYEGSIGAVLAGTASAPGILSSNIKDDPKTKASDINKGKDVDAKTVAPGKTIVTKQPEAATPDARTQAKADGNPTIEHLMAVNEEGGGVNVDDLVSPEQQKALESGDMEHPSLQGRSLSDDLQATPGQKADQLSTNDSIKSILEDVKLNKGLKKQEKTIVDSETEMFTRKDAAQKAALEDRTQDAFDAALAYQDAANKQAENINTFVETKQQFLAKDNQTMPEEELNSLETYVKNEKAQADEMVAGLEKKVSAENAAALNQFSEELENPENLKKSLKMAEAQDTVRSDAKGKIYRDVTDMMDLEGYTTPGYFLEGMNLNKTVKAKSDLERQINKEQLDPKVTPEAKAVDKATADYLDEQIRRKQGFDLEMDLAKERDARAKEEQAKLKEGAQRLTSSDPKVKADRAKVRGEKVTKTQEAVKRVAAAKAKKATAAKAKTQEKKRVEVQKQQPKVRKKPATAVADDRRQEIQASRKRAMAKRKQRDQAAELDKKPSTTLPKKAQVKDLKKADSSWTILTSDNPQSTQQSHMQNRQGQLKLAKELTALGIEYEIGRSKFGGQKETPFLIKGMTKKQAKELSDRLDQTSFIYAEGNNVDLIEGSEVRRVKKSDIRLAPNATDNYTHLNNEQFTIPFYTEKESVLEIDPAQYQMDPDEVRSAKKMFRGAAINYKGKTYEGSSHASILMQNDELTQAVLDTPAHLIHSTFDHGFVTHEGGYVDRMAAIKALNLKKGAYLQSENFIQPALKVKAEQLQKETNMEIDNFDNMSLKDQMGTLEMVDELKSRMKDGKYSWLFKKTVDDLGVETHFITAKGQYRSMDAVKKVYPDMRSLDAAVTRFEGDVKLDQATGWMIPTGGVQGLYLRMQPMKGNMAGQAIINMPIIGKKVKTLDQAEETVVHEHVHGLVDHGVKNMSPKEQEAFKKDLTDVWESIPEDFVKETRDDKNTHIRIRTGIGQIQRDGIGELVSYSMAHPEFAAWLNTIPASPRFRAKSSKIKTMWDALVNLMVTKAMKVPTKLNEVTDVLNRHLKMGDADIRYSKETDFDFGANVSLDNVTEWNQEMIDQASDIAESVVVQTVEEAEKLTGKKIVGRVPSIWTGETKVKRVVYGGKKPKTITTVSPEKVIFIADNIDSREHFVKKWMHEQVTHHGLRSVFGENKPLMNRFLEQAYGMFSIKDKALVEEVVELYGIGVTDPSGRLSKLTTPQKRLVAEEVIALRSEQLSTVTKRGLITRFKKFLARWLPKKFVGVKDTFEMKDQDVWDLLEATKAKVIQGDTKFATMLVKSLEARGPRHAYKGWKTLPKFMESDETYMEWVAATHKANPGLRKWYDKHTAVIEKEFGPDADLFQVLLAITSPQADVETNVQFAVDTYAYLMGKKDKPGGLYPNTLKEKKLDKWTSPEALFRSLESANFKVTEFGRALLGDVDATVGDLWMFRAFFGDHAYHKQAGETFSKPNVVAMRQKLHDLAQKMTEKTGETHTPREIQAAIWIHINSQSTGKDLKEVADYMSGLKRVIPKYGDKTPLEWLKSQVPNLSDGPLSKKLGVTKMPLAPMSPLAKQRIQQIRMEMKAKKQKTKYDVNKSGHIMFKPVNEDTDIQNLMDAIVEGGRSITPVDQTQGDWLKEMFGFEYQDDNTMVLSERAENLFKSEKTGKVSFGDIRDNLGGFSGAYTQEVRFAREAREATEDIGLLDVTDPKHDAEWLMTGNEGSSVVNQIHEKRDLSERRVDRFITKLEQEFLKLFGGRRTAAGKSGLGTGRLMHTRATEVTQRAFNLFIDSGTGTNRTKAENYAKKLRKQGKLTGTQREQLVVIDRMLGMTAGEIGWVNENIRPYYEDYFKYAQANNLVDSHRDNYVKRMWQMPKKYEDAGISWSGSNATTGFTLTPTFGKQRTLDSIVDGWEEGLTLLQGGVINNLGSYAKEMGYVMANRQFVDYMKSLKTFKTGGLMHEYKSDSGMKPPEGYTKLQDRGFAKPGHVVYAKTELANIINKLSDKPSWKLWNIKGIKQLRRLNSRIKSTILSVSLFHHLAGMRSYVFGVRGKKWGQWNPIKAYKRGLAELDADSGTRLKNPEYYHLGPVVDMLVKEGLTVGRTQDWEESVGQPGYVEEFLEKRTSKLGYRALRGWQAARRAREQMTTGLFNRLFAGLKAEAGSIEFIHKIQQKEKSLGRSLNDGEMKLLAQQVATLVNADFGGLHLSRMGRNPDLQRLAQMTLLAPDWTESNWRTVTGMIPGVNKFINDRIGDNKELKGMGKVYRGFWWGVLGKTALSMVLTQGAILALFADEEEREEYYDFVNENFWSWKKITKGRWASVDLTPMLGKTADGKRRVFSLLGHFKDILKIGNPVELAKHKISPTARVAETIYSGSDWKGSRFTTLNEFLQTGQFTAEGGKYAEEVSGLAWWSTIISLAGYNMRQSIPIFGSNALEFLQGESTFLAATARAGGLDVRDVSSRSVGQRKFEEVRKEINALDKNLKEAKTTKDKTAIKEAKQEIKEYPNFNQAKSRMNYARTQLSVVNRKIKGLEKLDKLSPKQEKDLKKLKDKKEKIFEKFYKVINR